jgi:Bacterial Ig-like domain (group 3)/FG-GAP-like repeat
MESRSILCRRALLRGLICVVLALGASNGLLCAQTSTSTSLAVSATQVTLGQPFTLTATVAPNLATGAITFMDGMIPVGSAALASGQAVFTTQLLGAGVHSLKAVYVGNVGYAGSMSSIVSAIVTAVPGAGFAAASGKAVGANPTALTTEDFNQDGKLDLAVANSQSHSVSILLGTGGGDFQAAVNYPAGANSQGVATGDFNLDGKMDLAVAAMDSADVNIMLGSGDGAFQSAVSYATGAGCASVVVADFNEDGKPDLATANFDSDTMSMLLGNGNGTFQPAINSAVSLLYSFVQPRTITVGDFNGDGHADVTTANYGGSGVSILLGNGSGTFQAPSEILLMTSIPFVIVAADLNRDGRSDLAISDNLSNSVRVLKSNPDGSFETTADIYGLPAGVQGLTVTDLNGDGNLDLAVGTAFGTIATLIGFGNGQFNQAGTTSIAPLNIFGPETSMEMPEPNCFSPTLTAPESHGWRRQYPLRSPSRYPHRRTPRTWANRSF